MATGTKQAPCSKASGRMNTVGDIDKRRRVSEGKLAQCAAKVNAMNAEIDKLRKVGTE